MQNFFIAIGAFRANFQTGQIPYLRLSAHTSRQRSAKFANPHACTVVDVPFAVVLCPWSLDQYHFFQLIASRPAQRQSAPPYPRSIGVTNQSTALIPGNDVRFGCSVIQALQTVQYSIGGRLFDT